MILAIMRMLPLVATALVAVMDLFCRDERARRLG